MNVARFNEPNFNEQVRHLMGSSTLFDPEIEERARTIIDSVRTHGDKALLEFTERFDGAKLTPDQLEVTTAELLNSSLNADDPLRAAIKVAASNIERFSRKSLRKPWSVINAQGAQKGRTSRPLGPLARSCPPTAYVWIFG